MVATEKKLVIECEFHYGEKLIFIDQIKRQVAGGEKKGCQVYSAQ